MNKVKVRDTTAEYTQGSVVNGAIAATVLNNIQILKFAH